MALSSEFFAYIAELVRDRKMPTASCLQIGRQQIMFGFETLIDIGIRFGFVRVENGKIDIPAEHPFHRFIDSDELWAANPDDRKIGRVSDRAAFAMLGFARVDSLDYDDSEGSTIIWDLNVPGLGRAIETRYDLIIDGGTLEHVFHLPRALENIIDVLAVGGYMWHINPMNNYVDHGFYQFSPTLFMDFYAANRFDLIDATIAEQFDEANSRPIFLRRYERDGRRPHDSPYVRALDSRHYLFLFAARKTAQSTSDRIPEQTRYAGAAFSGHPALAGVEKLVVWGAGALAVTVVARRIDLSRIEFFVDNSERRQGETCLGLPIRSPRALASGKDHVVLIASTEHEHAIRLQISREFGDSVARIVSLSELMSDRFASGQPTSERIHV